MDYNALAELLFPEIDKTPDYYEKTYAPRNLGEDARVTRFAPSPTGFMHLGNLYGAFADERLAHLSGGVFFLRIEDTDLKRQVPGAIKAITDSLGFFGITFDEGELDGGTKGDYGPYRQRAREEIYKVYAKELVKKGRAYPCFCTEEKLQSMRDAQAEVKDNFGYYGKYAVHRDMSLEDIKKELDSGKAYVLRFKSEGNPEKMFTIKDAVRGEISMPENYQDMVLLKSDGIPTYHFAHVVDDHLMRTTTVVRGEEWLSTLPFHYELFAALNFPLPEYIHTCHLLKNDGEGKRKLSKRKDEEAALGFYMQKGYPPQALLHYLMTLLNSDFEPWYAANPDKTYLDFYFKPEKMSISGALFDLDKLNDISKDIISRFTAGEVYDQAKKYAENYDEALLKCLEDREYAQEIFRIGRGGEKPRKDITYYSQLYDYMSFFFDDSFKIIDSFPENVSQEDINTILTEYSKIYDENDTGEEWFAKIKALCVKLGYAERPKDYKKEPDKYKGHVGDVSMVLRVAITGKQASPDLCSCMKILGKKRVLERIMNSL